jgi:hypothetical protein
MTFETYADDRRQVGPETRRAPDTEVARPARQGIASRVIVARMDMSLETVDKSVRRAAELASVQLPPNSGAR